MAAVITEDWRQFESLQYAIIPGALEYTGCNELVSFVEIGESAFCGEIGFVLRSVVTIEVGGGVPSLAVGVIGHGHKVTAEALLHFEGDALIEGISSGRIHIVLEDERIDETRRRNRRTA